MELTDEHRNFESYCRQQLVGLTIDKVEYVEIAYGKPDSPYYVTRFDNLHTIDFSIFIFSGQKVVEINWDGQFYQFGVGVKVDTPSPHLKGHRHWNVSETTLWSKAIGQNIADIKIDWEHVYTVEEKTRIRKDYDYPQVLRLTISNGQKIFISAAGFLNQEDDEVYGMLDNLTATDNEELARQVKMIFQ